MANKDQNKGTLLGLIALLWLMLVFVGYQYAHKPFSPDELLGMLAALWRTLIAVMILSAAGGIGIITPMRDWDVPPLTKAMLTGAIGLGALSVVILVLASVMGTRLPLWILLPTIFVLLRNKIILWWSYWKNEASLFQELSSFSKLLLLPVLVILICQYFVALAPPLQFDALTYHLALPREYFQLGKFAYVTENIFWGMPQLTEMLYLLAMSLGGSESAVILGFWVGVLAVLGLVDFTKSVSGENAGWVTAAVLFAGAGVTSSLSSGYVEWMSILFGATTLVTLYRWGEKNDLPTLIMTGIFAGLALSIKYTNGVLLLAAATAILILPCQGSFGLMTRNLTLFIGSAVLTFTPWLIKNFLATRNPFYPVIFPSGAMDAPLLDFYQFKPAIQDWSRLLLLPWQATILGVDGGDGYSSSIGPLLLGLSPLAWVNWREQTFAQKKIVVLSSVILISGLLIWAVGSQFRGLLVQTRLYFILFPAWAVLAGTGFTNVSLLKARSIRFGNLTGAMALLAVAFNAYSTFSLSVAINPVLAILNRESDSDYMKRNLGGYIDAMHEIESLPPDSKVIMLWETRSLLCIPICDPDEIIGRWYNDWTNHHNADEITFQWKEQGYTHVLIYKTGADFVRKYDGNAPPEEYWGGLDATLSSLSDMKIPVDGYQLYRIP